MDPVSAPHPLVTHTAVSLQRKLREGEVGALALVQALLDHGAHPVGESNWSNTVGAHAARCDTQACDAAQAADEARARGEGPSGPLAGLPVSIKDNIDVAGLPSTLGLVQHQHRTATTDAALVQRLRRKGAIILCKSNIPQLLASGMACSNPVWGTVRNPWTLHHFPGGSSGGEAALLASGQSLLGVGTDLGGSIRGPAAYCGVVGVKPTTGLIPADGVRYAFPGQECIRAQSGPMARNVADCELLFDALATTPDDAHGPRYQYQALPCDSSRPLLGRRLGWYIDDGFMAAEAPVRRAVESAAAACDRLGATLVPFAPTNQLHLLEVYVAALASGGSLYLRRTLASEPLEPYTRLLWWMSFVPAAITRLGGRVANASGQHHWGTLLSALGPRDTSAYWALVCARQQLQAAEARAWDDLQLDALLCPATVRLAAPLSGTGSYAAAVGYTGRYNLLGYPCGVLPWSLAAATDGSPLHSKLPGTAGGALPTAIQLVARPYREDVLFLAMRALEAHAPLDALTRTHAMCPRPPSTR